MDKIKKFLSVYNDEGEEKWFYSLLGAICCFSIPFMLLLLLVGFGVEF